MQPTMASVECAATALLSLSALAPQLALAIDCQEASTASEKAVCGNQHLLALDRRLNAEYARVRAGSSSDERQQLLAQQKGWLAQKDKCGADEACLKKTLETRLAELTRADSASPSRSERHGPFVVRSERAPRWDVVYPVIVSGPSGLSIEALKAELDQARRLASEGCAEDETTKGKQLSFTSRTEVVYADARYFTVKETWDYFCGGAYPDAGYAFTTYLVSTGKKLKFSEAFADSLTGDHILGLARKRSPNFDKQTHGLGCPDPDRPQYEEGVAVVHDGVLFRPAYPHAAQACEFDVMLPWADLKPFIAVKGPLAPVGR